MGEEALAAGDFDFDGRLSSLEAFPEGVRSSIIDLVTGSDWLERSMIRPLCSILSWYEDVPGAWLLLAPVRDLIEPSPDDARQLVNIIVEVVRDGHLNALVKCAPFSWLVLRGKISVDKSMVDLLRNYPLDDATRSMADSTIRASFGAQRGATELNHPERFARSREWARSFWNQNWRMFPCFPEEDAPDAASGDKESESAPAGTTAQTPGLKQDEAIQEEPPPPQQSPLDRVVALFESFLQDALDSEKPVDLYRPAKHEVICAFVSRAARAVFATLRAPHL